MLARRSTHFVLERRKELGLQLARRPGARDVRHHVARGRHRAELRRRVRRATCNVGFKWMAQIIQDREDAGRVGYFFATEESIGYLAGNFVRDKDASIAALLVAEMASALKDRGLTIWQYLDEIYAEFGCYRNLQHLVELPGKTGMQVMREVMLGLRRSPPTTLGGQRVVGVLDRLPAEKSTARRPTRSGSGDDMLTFVLSEDQRNRVTVRPSGHGAEAEVLHPAVRARRHRRRRCPSARAAEQAGAVRRRRDRQPQRPRARGCVQRRVVQRGTPPRLIALFREH